MHQEMRDNSQCDRGLARFSGADSGGTRERRERKKSQERGGRALSVVLCLFLALLSCGIGLGQEAIEGAAPAPEGAGARVGYQLDVPLPLTAEGADRLSSQIERLASTVDPASQQRMTVVLDFSARDDGNLPLGSSRERRPTGLEDESNIPNDGPSLPRDGRGTEFEAALRIARLMTGKYARELRTIAYVQVELVGHAVLVAVACDEIVVAPGASIGNASIDEQIDDDSVRLVYQSVAAKRGLFPEAVIGAFVDQRRALYRVAELDGTERFVGEETAAELRTGGKLLSEVKLADSGRPAVVNAQQLRDFRWASQVVDEPNQLASQLGLSELLESDSIQVELTAVRVEVRGPVNKARVRRIQSNLSAAFEGQQINSVYLELDSPGGDLNSSLELGLECAAIGSGPGKAIGYVASEVRSDSVLIVAGCKPVIMHSQARIGGLGAGNYSREDVLDLQAAIEQLAATAGRPVALLYGLLDPSLEVYRYTHRRTGQVAYMSEIDVEQEDLEQWERRERIELADGISAAQAIQLGLADGQADTTVLAAKQAGLDTFPAPLSDRPIIHTVEWLGGLPWLGPLLIFAGFMAFSVEMSAPGLGVPGFISLLCFMLFFWMKFLSGTAEWLEVVLFVGGVICILVEVLLIPGVGIFGIGGLVMVISSIVLVSQTFVIPQNDYQIATTLRGLLTVVAAFMGVVMGMVALRYLLPGTPVFRDLIMPGPNSEEMIEQEQREHLVRYDHLLGEEGVAITPLKPAGKARIGDQVVAVISDGDMLAVGAPLRVISVQGNRIVVESV